MNGQELRQHARLIFDAALAAVDPARAVAAALGREGPLLRVGPRAYDLDRFRRVIAVGAGKAGAPMAQALEDILGDRLEGGLVVVKDGHGGPTRRVELAQASHPVPDQRGVAAAGRLAAMLAEAGADTLVFCLLSGGGSALLPAPAPGLSLADKQAATALLLACGAEIGQVNAVRKHLSTLKGGGLACLAFPATLVCLIISDVVGDRLEVVASGPATADPSTWAEVGEVMDGFGLWPRLPEAVRLRVEAGLAGQLSDTPKPGDPRLKAAQNLVIASNRQALAAAAERARQLGYAPLVLGADLQGEAAGLACLQATLARRLLTEAQTPRPCCLLSGGETTVSLDDNPGQGGRNQEYALVAACELEGLKGVFMASLGSDGTDGPTDAAGAWADGQTLARARALGLDAADHLARHDAYNFFAPLGDLIITGPTRTNVMDLRLTLLA